MKPPISHTHRFRNLTDLSHEGCLDKQPATRREVTPASGMSALRSQGGNGTDYPRRALFEVWPNGPSVISVSSETANVTASASSSPEQTEATLPEPLG